MTKKIGRNEPCPCGSGKKYKKCHGSFAAQAVEASQPRPDIAKLLEQVRAQDKIREAQQGRGRAIVFPFGLGMSDFNRPGMIRLSDAYRNKQKHIDAFEIGQAFLQYTNLPSTFDGSLPSEAFGGASNRVI